MRSLLRRLHYVLNRSRIESELAEEIAFHEEMKRRELEASGVGGADARHASRRVLGNVALAADQARDVWVPRTLQGIGQDLRFAFRALRKTPVVTCAAVLSIALGIGANTALFSVIDALVLRSVPVEKPERLVFIRGGASADAEAFTYPTWRELRDRSPFESVASWGMRRFNLAAGGEAHMVEGMWASGSYFETLGVQALLGRTFTIEDDRPAGGPDGPVAVISYAFWQREFGGAPDVIGRTLPVEGVPFTIVGVTPRSFFGLNVGRDFDVAIPLETEPLMHAPTFLDAEGGTLFLFLVARLHTGQLPDAAVAALRRVQPQIREATIGPLRKFGPRYVSQYLVAPFTVSSAQTGMSSLRTVYARPLAIIMTVVLIVLLIACANIANLLLARGIARRRDFDVRIALGASRWRVARQLFAESMILSVGGGVIGLVFAVGAAPALVAQLSTPDNPVRLSVALDSRVLAFTAALTMITTMLFGTMPTLRTARLRFAWTAARGVANATEARRGLASWLIVGQIALAMVLLVAGGLFIRTFAALAARPLGFDREPILVTNVDPQRAVPPADRIALYGRLLDAVRSVPDVADAAVSLVSPVTAGQYTPPIEILETRETHTGEHAFGNLVSPGWFRTYGVRLLAGRDFAERDRRGAPRVAVVNEAFVRRFLDHQPPIGHTVALYPQTPMTLSPIEIVGVVANAVYSSLREPAPATIYLPMEQMDHPAFPLLWQNAVPTARISARVRHGSPEALIKAVSAAMTRVDPHVTLRFQPLREQVSASVRQERVVAWLAGLFGALALLLTALGLYGLTSYGVTNRRTEIGIRTALGATPGTITGLVLKRVSLLTAGGIAAGALMTFWFGRLVTTMLYGVTAHDVMTMVTAAVLLTGVAGGAALGPVRAALQVAPADVLKET